MEARKQITGKFTVLLSMMLRKFFRTRNTTFPKSSLKECCIVGGEASMFHVNINENARVSVEPRKFGCSSSNISLLQRLNRHMRSVLLWFSNDDENIPDLTQNNFHDYLQKNKKTFVMFYDPFCPVCRRMHPNFEKLYSEMKHVLRFGAVDAMKNQELAISEDIKAFPTFRLYVCNGRCNSKSYEGALTVDEMRSFVRFSTFGKSFFATKFPGNPFDYLKLKVSNSSGILSQLHFKHFSTSSWVCTIPDVPKFIKVGKRKLILNRNVMEVNGANFQSKIKTFNSALVYFYTTWCVHCAYTLNQFMKAAEHIDEPVGVLAICNAEESLEVVDQYFVGKIPTIKLFQKGKYVTDYVGEINSDLLVKFMKDTPIGEGSVRTDTKHKPQGDLFETEILTPTQKKKLWGGKDGSEMILEVTTHNINDLLKENSSLLLLFYACWNKMCVGLKYDYINVAKAVEDSDVVLAACDCEEYVEVADRFLVSRFPTLKYFRNGMPVRDYIGDYHADSILKFLKDPSKLQIALKDEHASIKRMDDMHVPSYWKGVEGGDKLLHFTDSNYKELMEEYPTFLLMFYVTWCKSCTPIKRELGQAALKLPKATGVFAACDAETNNEMADKFSVIKLPTFKYYKENVFVADYTGKRTVDDFISFMKKPPIQSPIFPDARKGLGK